MYVHVYNVYRNLHTAACILYMYMYIAVVIIVKIVAPYFVFEYYWSQHLSIDFSRLTNHTYVT